MDEVSDVVVDEPGITLAHVLACDLAQSLGVSEIGSLVHESELFSGFAESKIVRHPADIGFDNLVHRVDIEVSASLFDTLFHIARIALELGFFRVEAFLHLVSAPVDRGILFGRDHFHIAVESFAYALYLRRKVSIDVIQRLKIGFLYRSCVILEVVVQLLIEVVCCFGTHFPMSEGCAYFRSVSKPEADHIMR